jgi:chromosome partitioning protein
VQIAAFLPLAYQSRRPTHWEPQVFSSTTAGDPLIGHLATWRGERMDEAVRDKPIRRRTRVSVVTTTKWLVIASGKGGTSKTTLTLNLGTRAAADGLRVGLLDSDEQETLTKWHRRRQEHEDLPPLTLFTRPLSEISRAIAEIDGTSGLDIVIVDTPPGLDQHLAISQLIRRADFVLVPSSQSMADLESVSEFMSVSIRLNARAAFVLARTNQRWSSYRVARQLLSRAGSLCPVDIRQLRDIEACHDHGLGVNEFDRARGADDVDDVWRYVRRELEV